MIAVIPVVGLIIFLLVLLPWDSGVGMSAVLLLLLFFIMGFGGRRA